MSRNRQEKNLFQRNVVCPVRNVNRNIQQHLIGDRHSKNTDLSFVYLTVTVISLQIRRS